MRWLPLLLLMPLAGCLGAGPGDDAAPGPAAAWTPCEHPWPCGDEWPADLSGPFPLPAAPQELEITAHDGTPLRGWLFLPDVPTGTPVPTMLSSSPYYGLDAAPPARTSWGAGPIDLFLEHGYAFAAFSVRGTGVSGGCFENKGANEQQDQVTIVEWLAAQPWSNGRIGMIGISYPGTTPWMAAIQTPEALKTIVPIGPVTDPYTELHSPQGALYSMGGPNDFARRAAVTYAPLYGSGTGTEGPAPQVVFNTLERACPDLIHTLTVAEQGHFLDTRDAAFWAERRLSDHFPDVTAAVYLAHGLQETAHPFQEDPVWNIIPGAPKQALFGQWDHEVPRTEDWGDSVIAWTDFWLKGIGDPLPGLGTVEYQDTMGAWHVSTHWPPAEAREEVLYLHPDGLETTARAGNLAFRSAPPPPSDVPHTAIRHLCDDGSPAAFAAAPFGVSYLSEPASMDTLIAGNPHAYLRLESDLPGGQIALHLFSVPSDPCQSVWLSKGMADLRFHDGVMQGHDFPVAEPTPVRIDLLNLAAVIRAGHRLGIVAHWGDLFATNEIANPLADDRYSRSGQPYFPELIIRVGNDRADGSHVVLPIVAGGFGGQAPTLEYPPRPFLPVVA